MHSTLEWLSIPSIPASSAARPAPPEGVVAKSAASKIGIAAVATASEIKQNISASRARPLRAISEGSLQSSRPIFETAPAVVTQWPALILLNRAGAASGSTTMMLGALPQ